MNITTLYPREASFSDIRPTRQGRSKKTLRPVIEHDGRVFVARYEGRPNICFGANEQEALRNLRIGEQQ